MIKQQCRMLVTNSRFMLAGLLAIAFTLLLLYYQEQKDVLEGIGRAKCLSWAMQQEEPVQALTERAMEIYEPDFLLSDLQFSDNQFEEMVLCYDTAEYLESIENYEALLEQIITQRENIKNFPDVTAGKAAVSGLEAERYRQCSGSPVKMGNYMAFEKFFSFGAVDICLWGIVFLICYFLIAQEREKGLGQLVYASAGGGIRYFFTKLWAVELMTLAAFSLLFGGKALLFGGLYGYGDSSAAIQSMQGYFGSPYQLSIAQYLFLFVCWKLVGTMLLALLVLALCSLPLTEAVCGASVFAVLGGSVLIKNAVPAFSKWVLFRDGTLFSILSPEYWFTGLRSYCLGNASRLILISGIGFPVFCGIVLAALLCAVGVLLYYKGLRKSTAAHRSRSKALFRFGSNRWWNEGYYLGIHRKLLLTAVSICFLYGSVICSYEPIYSETVKFEREVVGILNGKTFTEAQQWLNDKQAEIAAMEEQLLQMQEQAANGEISEEAYAAYAGAVSNQLRIKPVIETMAGQVPEMERCRAENGIAPQFEYTSLSGELYGDKGWEQRNWTAVMTACFVVFCAMTLFPDERSKGLHRMLGSTAGGTRSVRYRVLWLAGMTFLASAAMQLLRLYSLGKQFVWVGWDSPMQSWAVYRDAGFDLTVGGAVLAEVFWQSLKWAAAAGAGVWLSLYFANTAWAELTGLLLFVMPPVLHIVGLSWFRRLPHVRGMIYGESSLFSGAQAILWVLLFGAVVLIGVKKETKRWMEA